jgi:hypothetical protein
MKKVIPSIFLAIQRHHEFKTMCEVLYFNIFIDVFPEKSHIDKAIDRPLCVSSPSLVAGADSPQAWELSRAPRG